MGKRLILEDFNSIYALTINQEFYLKNYLKFEGENFFLDNSHYGVHSNQML